MMEGFRIWWFGTMLFIVLVATTASIDRNTFVSFWRPLAIFAALAWCLGIPVVYAAKVLLP